LAGQTTHRELKAAWSQMKTQTVFYLSDYQAIVYQVVNQELFELRCFPNTPEGVAGFAQWLPGSPIQAYYMPLALVVDTRSEEYQFSDIPRVRGRDRRDLLQLRLRRLFANADYSYARVPSRAGYHTGQRNEDRALLSCLTNPDLLRPWIAALLQQKVSIRGVYSLPLLSEAFLKDLEAPDYCLLLSYTGQLANDSPRSLRQSFFVQRYLSLSRLLALPAEQGPGQDAHSFLVFNEILKTRQYLRGINLLPHTQPLSVLVFGNSEQIEQLRQYFSKQPVHDLSYHYHEVSHFLHQQGLSRFPNPPYLGFLNLSLAAKHPPADGQYARPAETCYYRNLRLRRWILAGAAGVLLLSLLSSGHYFWQAWQTEQAHLALEAAQVATAANYQTAREQQRQTLGSDIDVLHIKNTVDAAVYLGKQQIFPERALGLLGHYLTDYPLLALKELRWQVELRAKRSGLNNDNELSALQQRLLEKRQAAGGSLLESVQSLQLRGEIWPFDGNASKALERVRNLVSALRRDPAIRQVEEIELPLNINPDKALRGQIGANQNNQNLAPFHLNLALQPDAEPEGNPHAAP